MVKNQKNCQIVDLDATAQDEKFMNHIEKFFLLMHKEMERIFSNQSTLKDRLVNGSRNLDPGILELQDDLGEKPSQLIDKVDAPSLWGTVGVMGSSILGIEEDHPQKDNLTKEDVKN